MIGLRSSFSRLRLQSAFCSRVRRLTKTRWDWGVVLALALALVAAAAFLTRPGLPRQTDAELHVYRAAELGHVLRSGVVYVRWAPDFFLGYGYPIFNYYAPLTYYLANVFDLLPGVDIIAGVKSIFVLGLVLASVGTYLLARELHGRAAGVVAAASFTFAPYVVLIDPHTRGDLAEHFAICLLPMAFYLFHCLMSGVGGWTALVGSVLAMAALVTSHNLLGPVGVSLLFAYGLWEVSVGGNRDRAGWGAAAFLLATAMTAFFWLPILLEWNAVELTVTGPGHFDYRRHFVPLAELLAPSRVLDLGATAPRYRTNLGLAQWLLALAALGAVARQERQSSSWYFILASAGLVFLMTRGASLLWALVPLASYLQFPWRLLGPANLMLALAGAVTTSLVTSQRWRAPVLAAGLALILGLALPVLYPPMWAEDFGGTSPTDIIEWEWQSGAFGTTSTGDFVPTGAARTRLRPQPTLVESYSSPDQVDKVNRATLPASAEVNVLEHGPLHDRLSVSSPVAFALRLYTFRFPGWRAYVDAKEVSIDVARPEGFIVVPVPAGEHEVLVRFSDTPARTAGWAISAAGAVGLVGVAKLVSSTETRRRRRVAGDVRVVAAMGGVLLLFALVKSWAIDTNDNWLRYTSPPGQAWAAEHELSANFGDQFELLGYDLPAKQVRSGDSFPMVLYWRALTPMGVNYQSFVHVTHPLHILWGQEDHLNPGDLPTTRWPLDRYVWDEYDITVLPGTPPGEYALNVGLYSLEHGTRLLRLDSQSGGAIGDSLIVASLNVQQPRSPPDVSELGLTEAVTATFPEHGVTLLGFTQFTRKLKLPDPLYVTLFWRADNDRPATTARDLVLRDTEGNEVWRAAGVPADYAFAMWSAGEVVRDPLVFVPAEMPQLRPGWHDLSVTVKGDGRVAELYLGQVKFKKSDS